MDSNGTMPLLIGEAVTRAGAEIKLLAEAVAGARVLSLVIRAIGAVKLGIGRVNVAVAKVSFAVSVQISSQLV